MTCGSAWPQARPMRMLFARCTSMKLRWRPPSLQNGLSAFTTPAPFVHRLPIPPASVTTATRPAASACMPASRWRGSADLHAFRKMYLDEAAMAAAEFAERVERLHHPRAFRPAAADTAGERDHGDAAFGQRLHAGVAMARVGAFRRGVFDAAGEGQPVL